MKSRLLFIFLVALLIVSCSGVDKPKVYKPKLFQHFEETIFQPTERGAYTVELICKPYPPAVGDNTVDLIVHDYTGKDVGGAEISFSHLMPDTGHTPDVKPTIEDTKVGLYYIRGIVIDRPGRWVYRIGIRKGRLEDTITITLPEIA